MASFAKHETLFHETSQGQRATERIDPINSAQGSDIQDTVATASDGPRIDQINLAQQT